MKKRNISFFFVLILTLLFSGCGIPNMQKDLKLLNDSRVYAGYREVCENAYIKLDCFEGLECRTTTTKPYITKVCLNPGEPVPEDLVYMNPYDNNETYIVTKNKPKNLTLEEQEENPEN